MRNFNYNAANQSVFDGYRVIALKNADMEKLANAANMREPEIVAGPETVVEPQLTVQEPEIQNVSDAQNVANKVTSDEVIQQNAPGMAYNEPAPSVTPAAPEATSVNVGNINIPDPVVTPQTTVSQSSVAPQQTINQPSVASQPEPVVESSNIFDAPVVRENVEPKPVVQQEMTQSPAESGLVDLDEFMIKSQEIYDRAKSAMEDALVKSQREQMNLVMQMMKNLQQLKADNAAYSNAIDQVVNDQGFKKVV